MLLVILVEKQEPALKLLFGMNTYHNSLHFIGQSRSPAGPGSVAWGSLLSIDDSSNLQWVLCAVPSVVTFRVPESAPFRQSSGCSGQRGPAPCLSQSSGEMAITPRKGPL